MAGWVESFSDAAISEITHNQLAGKDRDSDRGKPDTICQPQWHTKVFSLFTSVTQHKHEAVVQIMPENAVESIQNIHISMQAIQGALHSGKLRSSLQLCGLYQHAFW